MKLVIDIPEDHYEMIQNIPNYISADATQLIRDGKPLPKGHGRLMILSEDAVKKEQLEIPLNFSCQKWINEVSLSNATLAIIEADKENEKDEHMTADEFAELFTGRDKE